MTLVLLILWIVALAVGALHSFGSWERRGGTRGTAVVTVLLLGPVGVAIIEFLDPVVAGRVWAGAKGWGTTFSRGFDNVGGTRFVIAGLALAMIALPLDPGKDEVLVRTGFYALAALGLNVVVGLAGLLDLGYVAFFMIGAYTVGMLTESNATAHPAILAPWIILPVAVFVAMIMGLILGTPTLRLRGDYLAIVTLGFHEITRQSAKNIAVVNGSRGLVGIPHPDITLAGMSLRLAGLVVLLFGLGIIAAAWLNSVRAWRKQASARDAHGMGDPSPTPGGAASASAPSGEGSAGVGGIVAGLAGQFQRSLWGGIANATALVLVTIIGIATIVVAITQLLLRSDTLAFEFGVLEPEKYWFVIAAFMVVALYLINQLKDSRVGRAWEAIREDEVAASSMGIPVVKYKLYAFAIGASTSGLAGWVLATKVGFVNPNTFPLLNSILELCAVVIGGIGSSLGSLVGAAIVFGVPELLRDIGIEEIPSSGPIRFDVLTGRIAIFGLILVLMMIFRPGGFISSSRRRAELGGMHDVTGQDVTDPRTVEARDVK